MATQKGTEVIHGGSADMDEFLSVYAKIRSKLTRAVPGVSRGPSTLPEAGLDIGGVHWSHKLDVIWNDILLRAMREKKVEVLLDKACSGKPELETLRGQFLVLLRARDPRSSPSDDEKLPFPLKPDFLEIVSAIKNGSLVPVLGPSVNPDMYNNLAAHLVKLLAEVQLSEDKDQEKFVRSHFGLPCSICHYLPTIRPNECQVLKGVQRDPPCLVYNEQILAVAKANCRSLSQLYEIKETMPDLYGKIKPCIIGASEAANEVHRVLVRLIKKWPEISARGEPGQTREEWPALPYRFIITSNWDTGLERVLSLEQIPYDLVWCEAAGENKGKWMYMRSDDDREPVVINPKGKRKRPKFRTAQRVTILKVFGTVSHALGGAQPWFELLDDSFVITQDQMEFFQSESFDEIPDELTSQLKDNSSKILFLGFSPNDPDLRAIIHSICAGEGLTSTSWIVHQCEPGKLDQEIWSKRKRAHLVRVEESLERTMIDIEREICDV